MLGNSSGKKKICTLDELLNSETPEESNFEILQRASQNVDEQELSEALFSPGTVSYLHATRQPQPQSPTVSAEKRSETEK